MEYVDNINRALEDIEKETKYLRKVIKMLYKQNLELTKNGKQNKRGHRSNKK